MSEQDPRLAEYALGRLDDAERREFEAELLREPALRAALGAVLEALSEYGASLPCVEPSPSLDGWIRALVAGSPRFEGFVDRLTALLDLSASRVREILDRVGEVGEAPWESPGLPGMHILHFDGGARVARADCGLVHLQPGASFPRHRHLGDEWGVILEGHGQEGDSPCWSPGDVVYRPAGSEHAFRAVGDRPLVFAVVLYEGLELL